MTLKTVLHSMNNNYIFHSLSFFAHSSSSRNYVSRLDFSSHLTLCVHSFRKKRTIFLRSSIIGEISYLNHSSCVDNVLDVSRWSVSVLFSALSQFAQSEMAVNTVMFRCFWGGGVVLRKN